MTVPVATTLPPASTWYVGRLLLAQCEVETLRLERAPRRSNRAPKRLRALIEGR
jgi:hypothetical protein